MSWAESDERAGRCASLPGCAERMPNWRWSGTCSGATWLFVSRTRWRSSGGRIHRFPRAAHRIQQAVACQALGCPCPGSNKWRAGVLPPQQARRKGAKAEVGPLFDAHRSIHGAPRITTYLKEAGWRVSENALAALTREQGPGGQAQLPITRSAGAVGGIRTRCVGTCLRSC